MAPFYEGEYRLSNGWSYILRDCELHGNREVLKVRPDDMRLTVEVENQSDYGKSEKSAEIVLNPKEGIVVGDKKVEWKDK